MSNLNNLYGIPNSCPAIMNDGRGVNTNFSPRNDYFQEIKDKINSNTSIDFRKKLTKADVSEQINEFRCNNDPHGNIIVSSKIGEKLPTSGGSWLHNFASLK